MADLIDLEFDGKKVGIKMDQARDPAKN